MTMDTLRGSVDGLKALAHPARLRILALLRSGELCVCQLMEILGLAASTVSEHLSLLRRSGFVTERKEGKWVFYALTKDPAVLPLCEALWGLVGDDVVLGKDQEACVRVRKTPLSTLCRMSPKSDLLVIKGTPPSREKA